MNKIKINCLFLAYRNLEIIKISLGSILDEIASAQDRFEIRLHVVENRSENTDKTIKEYLLTLVEQGLVESYLCLDENITNNYIHLVFNSGYLDRWPCDYYIFTDGDIYVPKGTVSEQLHILKTCNEVVACGLSVDYSMWALSNKLDKGRALADLRAQQLNNDKLYISMPSGFWFLMISSSDWALVYSTFESNGLRIVDGIVQKYCRMIMNREWVQTKLSVGRELHRENVDKTYNGVAVKKQVINELKSGGYAGYDYDEPLYNHNRIAAGTLFVGNLIERFNPPNIANVNPTKSITYKYDPWVTLIQRGQFAANYVAAHYVRKVPKVISNNLYFLSRGIGTSFFLKNERALFVQMRAQNVAPLSGPINTPSFFSCLNQIYIDNFFNDSAVLDDEFEKVLLDAYEILQDGGFIRIFLFERFVVECSDESEIISALKALKVYDHNIFDLAAMRNLLVKKLSFSEKYTIPNVVNLFSRLNILPFFELSHLKNDISFVGTVYKLNPRISEFFYSLKIIKPQS